jgi:hypothetical protein
MLSVLEGRIHATLMELSNGGSVECPDTLKAEAVKQFAAALDKQFTPRDPAFRVRMSNIGRPLCQLQMEKAGAPRTPMPYNHIVRMLIGDCVEIIMRMVLEMSGTNVTSDGDSVELNVSGHTIKGDSDLDIDGAVYDVKSSSPWAYKNKWAKGFEGLLEEDSFGYVGQLYGYADAQDKKPGGWVVVDKSSGEVSVVEVSATPEQEQHIRHNRKHIVESIYQDAPFMRCFDAEEETYYRKPTGEMIVPKQCSMCSYIRPCWPEANFRQSTSSTAKAPPYKWYLEAASDN